MNKMAHNNKGKKKEKKNKKALSNPKSESMEL